MSVTMKRGLGQDQIYSQSKRRKTNLDPETGPHIQQSLLGKFYPQVLTLREYLVLKSSNLPRLKRKKIAASNSSNDGTSLAHILDTTLVCVTPCHQTGEVRLAEKWALRRQTIGPSSQLGATERMSQAHSEMVDFAIWYLFYREINQGGKWPKHLLCDGYRTKSGAHGQGVQAGWTNSPGIYSLHPNDNVATVKSAPWPQLTSLLGQNGELIMLSLLVDASIYIPLQTGSGNVLQLSGIPICDLEPLESGQVSIHKPRLGTQYNASGKVDRRPSDITFVRSKILYARPALTFHGRVLPGLRNSHVLNRCPFEKYPTSAVKRDDEDTSPSTSYSYKANWNTTKVMLYIFPRQFGLHNVFTSVSLTGAQTTQKSQDYTFREEEIAALVGCGGDGADCASKLKIPKRLRGDVARLIQQLQTFHGRCSYSELLCHYCPDTSSALVRGSRWGGRPARPAAEIQYERGDRASVMPMQKKCKRRNKPTKRPISVSTSAPIKRLAELATPAAQVSAFCQAVLRKIIPNEFWGSGSDQEHNRTVVMKNVDRFIRLRRFENMSLHDVVQDIKISHIAWLAPPALQKGKMSQTDLAKRMELFNEFTYYVFDSLLIPLIRSNFYVTESNSQRYRLQYFRHDTWRRVTEPSIKTLKLKMYEGMKLSDASRTLDARALGYSSLRFLPKETTLRPIMNLRRRVPLRRNPNILGPSINTVLAPIHSVLRLERSRNPSQIGSSMFSVTDMFKKLKSFRSELDTRGESVARSFFFAKVDVQSAFDSIPQDAVVGVMAKVFERERYVVSKHVEIKPGGSSSGEGPQYSKSASKIARRWYSLATSPDGPSTLLENLNTNLAAQRKNIIYMGTSMKKPYQTYSLLELLESHVQENLVKIGKRFYRQKAGIPQGSVLSTALCNYFYADLEREHLSFLNSNDSLLMRLTDDFLLITTDRAKAARFVDVMHAGIPDYGVVVNPAKSLINFDLDIHTGQVASLRPGHRFPYCGVLIDCKSLEIFKEEQPAFDISNSLTVDFGHLPGQNFQRRLLNAFKIQSHTMYYDASYNSQHAVKTNLLAAFLETAKKMWAYRRNLPKDRRPRDAVVIRFIVLLVDVAYRLLTAPDRASRFPSYRCPLRKNHVFVLALGAFRAVFMVKNAEYAEVISWIDRQLARQDPSGRHRMGLTRLPS